MTILDRALRMGEAKQFKRYAKRVDAINAWEPELELLDDEELRAATSALTRLERVLAEHAESFRVAPHPFPTAPPKVTA